MKTCKVLKNALDALQCVEWGAIQRVGTNPFVLLASRPACGGIDPTDPEAHDVNKLGHMKKCKLAKAIKKTKQHLKEYETVKVH